MQEIRKQLELIKTTIEIDKEIIALQILKLKKLKCDDRVKEIISKLEKIDYSSVMVEMKEYLSKYNEVVVYEDEELQKLRLELKSLEKKLQKLSEQKSEYLNEIDEFNRLYHLKLGSLIQEILQLKQEILQKELQEKQKRYEEGKATHKETQKTIDELKANIEELDSLLEDIDEDDPAYEEINQIYEELKENLNELEDDLEKLEEELSELEDELNDEEFTYAKAKYEEFSDEYEHIQEESKDIFAISEDEKKELKKLYRKASRLCHPDIVVDELKEQTTEIIKALNSAYTRKDLDGVRKILNNLEKGIAFEIASDTIEDKSVLKAKIDDIKAKIYELKQEIKTIKQDDIFQLISEIDDWDDYFEEMYNRLQDEKENLVNEIQVILESKENAEIYAEDSDYTKAIKSIELPNFEKIRRYCNNLANNNEADAMQEYLAKQGKMHKALIYDALEQFIEQLEQESIDIIEWGCGQGIATMLVLDYIREKQLDIEVNRVVLIDDDKKAVERAMAQVDVLKEENFEILPLDATNQDGFINLNLQNVSLHLFANDTIDIDFSEVNFYKESYFVCLSKENQDFVDSLYDEIDLYLDGSNIITDRRAKVGRFEKYEKIFKSINLINIPVIDINEDEIPF